jgi:hypothetical protein
LTRRDGRHKAHRTISFRVVDGGECCRQRPADEETMMSQTPPMADLLGADAPTNWGRWGLNDELEALHYLDAGEVLRGVQHVKTGEVFTLQIQMGRSEGPGDPVAVR